jgi:hypothetical protein
MNDAKTLLEETNVVSLRTAYIHDDGDVVDFRLMPAWIGSSIPGSKPKGFDYVLQDCTWLYRHMRPVAEEEKLMRIYPPIVQQDVKPLVFEIPPEFRLIWTDSGDSVVLFFNGEPWAFIDEQTHQGYSKGVFKPKKPYLTAVGNLWNQELFEKIFKGYI